MIRMSYQVLARKWRPRAFAELVGQQHVVTALTNALTRGHLHHAYLLAGTRGVGKTTLARILAKSLNCEKGVSATPCGVCGACRDIDAGRFVDLLELDAASNTGVENMREILDNARYAPTVGRYKVYLIDEVHMLSKGAFNSMLKTLEEPPDHVKFILATTDPQRIPVTVLSRCLQFNLTPLSRAAIAERLAHVLDAESIACEAASLPLLATAAQGSLRDALSLLDQAIAYGGGEVREAAVRAMLGVVERDDLYRIVDALLAGDGRALIAHANELVAAGHAASSALDELASLFHRIAVLQVVPGAAVDGDADRAAGYAARMAAEMVQLAYQICVQGRADLALAPDEATGFMMTLLRLLAFEPATEPASAPSGRAAKPSAESAAVVASPAPRTAVDRNIATMRAPARSDSRAAAHAQSASAPAVAGESPELPLVPAPASETVPLPLPRKSSDWPAFVAGLRLGGMAAQLGAQSELKSITGNAIALAIPAAHKHLADKAYADKLKAAIDVATGRKMLLAFEIGEGEGSLASLERRQRAQARAEGEAAFRSEPFVRDLVAKFDATIRPETIEPLARDGAAPPPTKREAP